MDTSMNRNKIVRLQCIDFQWITGSKDDPEDQCAHGFVQFEINHTKFVRPEDGTWTVSASALYLLRTLSEDHTIINPVSEGNFLFPCCGFNVWVTKESRFKVECLGCSNGIDVEIIHRGDNILFRSSAGSEYLSKSEWQSAVVGFVDDVQNFYQLSSPKVRIRDKTDREGWAAF
jgi:hypothetical protein